MQIGTDAALDRSLAAAAHATSAHSYLMPYAAAAFLGAGLLFSLEPMVGKLVLPRLGGAPAVWNTCLLFFQAMLLAGYAYAHYVVRSVGVKRHAVLHIALLAVSLATLPPDAGATTPPPTASPVAWLLLTLLRSIGLPFFVLSATAPLVQHWLARTRHSAARDPYFLYAASNLGSLTGLALYPFVLEPLLGLRDQAFGWAAVYVMFAALIGGLAWQAGRTAEADSAVVAQAHRVSSTLALNWVSIAFVPSALLLTVTGYVTTDIAPTPLLWLVPLALYLATFVAAFGLRTQRPLRVMRVLQPSLTLLVGTTLLAGYNRIWLLPLHLLVLTLVAYLAHSRLAAERPHASELTAFYLWISVGGALGGVFGAIIAPLVLMPEVEYVVLLAAALLLPGRHGSTAPPALRTVTLGILILSVVGFAVAAMLGHPGWGAIIAFSVTLTLLLWRIDAGRIAVMLGVAVVLAIFGIAVARLGGRQTLARERNFFGTLRVNRVDDSHRLLHGLIMHGAQLTGAAERESLTTYYTREGPVGDVFGTLMTDARPARVAVVGLGIGTIACYRRPGDQWDLFEINPAVVRIATNPRFFDVLKRCAPDATIIIGDGRRMLQTRPAAQYDLIVLDAFSSDAIPGHLLTREAFELYLQRLKPDGLLFVHISNRYLDLAPVVAANATAFGAAALMRDDRTTNPIRRTPSKWVVLARSAERIESLADVPGWVALRRDQSFRLWTDDYTSLLAVIRVFRRSGD